MKTVVVTGYHHSGHGEIFDLLNSAGLKMPNLSRREKLSVAELHQRILSSLNLSFQTMSPNNPIEPGKLWLELATDLFLGNIDSNLWGWSGVESAYFLDFWRSMDENVFFVLAFASPEYTLKQMVCAGCYTTEQIFECLRVYQNFNFCLLHFYSRNVERCVIVDIETTFRQKTDFIQHLNSQWGLGLLLPNSDETDGSWENDVVGGEVASLVVMHVLNQFPELHSVYKELQSVAVCFYSTLGKNIVERTEFQLLDHFLLLCQDVQSASKVAHREPEPDKLKRDIRRIGYELCEAAAQAFDVDSSGSKIVELEEENELLLTQLHQVQEEFENCFLKLQQVHQSLGESRKHNEVCDSRFSLLYDFWIRYHPADLVIDLRLPFTGSNWYDPEQDGRWVGPLTVSTIALPQIHVGVYDLHICVVDAMDAAILDGFKLSLAGIPLHIERYISGRTAVISARVDTGILPALFEWPLQLEFPFVISPSSYGSDDTRLLAARISSVEFKLVL